MQRIRPGMEQNARHLEQKHRHLDRKACCAERAWTRPLRSKVPAGKESAHRVPHAIALPRNGVSVLGEVVVEKREVPSAARLRGCASTNAVPYGAAADHDC